MRSLLIGAARSGKSSLAAAWAQARGASVTCIVTALAADPEMAARIEAHRAARPTHWRVREETRDLAQALREESASGTLVLIDCLTLWTANCLWPAPPAPASAAAAAELPPDLARWEQAKRGFLAALAECTAELILVSNEVGAGVVPATPSGRHFADQHGRLNQQVAALCEQVFLVSAGLSLRLK
jgi:adenosylcobinamide kinase / adenosylcobinamide-phosphate guanylyltransferase